MPDLRELYQEVILEHSKAPRNYRELATANHRAEGYNPLRMRDFKGVSIPDDAKCEG
jgi:hypothetical protein